MGALNKFQVNGVTYFRLFIACPVCLDLGKHPETSFWMHFDNNCYGDIYVGENAFYTCTKCGQSAHVRNWIHFCPLCANSSCAFVKDSFQVIATALSLAGKLIQNSGVPWLQTFLANLYTND